MRSPLAVCRECRAGLGEAAGRLDFLSFPVAPVEPPKHVRERVFARSSGGEEQAGDDRPRAALAAFAVLVGLGWAYYGLYQESRRLWRRDCTRPSSTRGISSADTLVINAANGDVVLDVYNVPSLPQKLAHRV